MSKVIYLVMVILSVVLTIVNGKPSGMALSIVKDKSICRTVVDYDENESRIPRVIKVLRCAPDPYQLCPSKAGGDVRCCSASPLADSVQFSCTEVMDAVLVSDTTSGTYTMNVPVGCACIKHDTNQALE